MKKHLLMAAFGMLMITGVTYAQPTIHLKAGGNFSNWRGDGMDIFSSLVDLGASDWIQQAGYKSYYAGVSTTFPLGETISIEPGLQYSRVGATLQGNLAFKVLEFLGVKADVRAVTQRLELPVLVKAKLAPGLNIVAGPQLNYSMDSKVKLHGSVMGINLINTGVDIDGAIEPISASALGGLQYEFGNGFQLQATYEYGLSRIARDNSVDIYQNSVRVGMGIPIRSNMF